MRRPSVIFGSSRGVQGLHRQFHNGLIIETRGLEDGAGSSLGVVYYGSCFGHVLADAFQHDAITRSRFQNFSDVSAVAHAHTLYDAGSLVLGVLW